MGTVPISSHVLLIFNRLRRLSAPPRDTHTCWFCPMKKVRSLKKEIPPAEELDRARDQILKQLASFNPERDKIRTIYPSEAARQHGEDIIEQIVIELRPRKRPELSEAAIYNHVTMACGQIPKPTSPATEDKIARDVAGAANKLLCLLGNPDFPPYHIRRVFGSVQIWNEWIDRSERLAALTYRRPPPNSDPAKRACANLAYLLITKCTTQKPTGTERGLFRNVAGLLHQFACPTQDGEIADLKTGCDEVLRRLKAGADIENDGW